jgi:putative oxidoreductase
LNGGWVGKILSPWLTIRVQLGLAAIFIVAAVAKIADPPGFAHEVANYKLLPAGAINAMALWLPWLEIIIGLCFFFGVYRRTAGRLAAILLIVFIGALSINLARGRPVDCGCFGTSKAPRTEGERLADMKLAILRDVLFLGMVAQLLVARKDDRRVRTVKSS